jgi:HlyD family secretion protein
MKKFFKIFLLILFIVLFVWTFVYLYKKSEKKPIVYKTEKPAITNIVRKTVATGSVIPRNEIEIKPQISGIIETLFVEPGQIIKKGDAVAKVKIVPNILNQSNAENRLKRAKTFFDNAELDYNRNKPLREKGIISTAEFQSFELALKNAKEELEASKENLQIVREGTSLQAGSTGNTVIRSTVSGMVLDVPVEVGHSVIEANNFNAGTTIAIVADMNEMIFEGKVDESEVGKLKIGMDLILNIGAVEGQKFKAKLEYIAPKGLEDQGAIQFLIRAALDTENDVLIRAGYSANADIVLERKDSVLAIPEGLVLFEGNQTFVEIDKGKQKFEKKAVKLGLSDGLNIEVIDGLTINDSIKAGEVQDESKDKPEPKKEEARRNKSN